MFFILFATLFISTVVSQSGPIVETAYGPVQGSYEQSTAGKIQVRLKQQSVNTPNAL